MVRDGIPDGAGSEPDVPDEWFLAQLRDSGAPGSKAVRTRPATRAGKQTRRRVARARVASTHTAPVLGSYDLEQGGAAVTDRPEDAVENTDQSSGAVEAETPAVNDGSDPGPQPIDDDPVVGNTSSRDEEPTIEMGTTAPRRAGSRTSPEPIAARSAIVARTSPKNSPEAPPVEDLVARWALEIEGLDEAGPRPSGGASRPARRQKSAPIAASSAVSAPKPREARPARRRPGRRRPAAAAVAPASAAETPLDSTAVADIDETAAEAVAPAAVADEVPTAESSNTLVESSDTLAESPEVLAESADAAPGGDAATVATAELAEPDVDRESADTELRTVDDASAADEPATKIDAAADTDEVADGAAEAKSDVETAAIDVDGDASDDVEPVGATEAVDDTAAVVVEIRDDSETEAQEDAAPVVDTTPADEAALVDVDDADTGTEPAELRSDASETAEDGAQFYGIEALEAEAEAEAEDAEAGADATTRIDAGAETDTTERRFSRAVMPQLLAAAVLLVLAIVGTVAGVTAPLRSDATSSTTPTTPDTAQEDETGETPTPAPTQTPELTIPLTPTDGDVPASVPPETLIPSDGSTPQGTQTNQGPTNQPGSTLGGSGQGGPSQTGNPSTGGSNPGTTGPGAGGTGTGGTGTGGQGTDGGVDETDPGTSTDPADTPITPEGGGDEPDGDGTGLDG